MSEIDRIARDKLTRDVREQMSMERDTHGDWLRITIRLGGWDQRFLSELAKANGASVPAYVGSLIRARLQEERERARK